MGLCGESKKKKPFKTIIIPKGTIDPNENNVIEIPMHMDTNSSLIVKASSDTRANFSVEPYQVADLASTYALVDFGAQTQMLPSGLSAQMPSIQIQPQIQPQVQQPQYQIQVERPPQVQLYVQEHPQPAPPVQQTPHQSTKEQDPHSPCCPICSQVGCNFLRPFATLPRCSFATTPRCSFSTIPRFSYPCPMPTIAFDTYRPRPRIQLARSESLIKTKPDQQSDLISRIVDEKVDTLLKPILFSLVRTLAPPPDRVTTKSCSCSPRESYETLLAPCPVRSRPRYREEEYPRLRNSFQEPPRYKMQVEREYEDPEECRAYTRRRRDRPEPPKPVKVCSPATSCPKRTFDNFDPLKNNRYLVGKSGPRSPSTISRASIDSRQFDTSSNGSVDSARFFRDDSVLSSIPSLTNVKKEKEKKEKAQLKKPRRSAAQWVDLKPLRDWRELTKKLKEKKEKSEKQKKPSWEIKASETSLLNKRIQNEDGLSSSSDSMTNLTKD